MGEANYYEILGIEVNATEDDIRKAYRKQALLWHPDKNTQRKEEAEAKFKLIAEAYEVLSDPDKKRAYDLYGEEGLKNNGPDHDYDFSPNFGFQFHDPREIFNRFFGGNDPFAEMLGNSFFGGGLGRGMPGFGTRSPFFEDDGFSGPFGNFGPSGLSSSSSYSFSSSSSSGGQGGFVSRSTSTKIVNGVATTVIKTVDAQGNETVITETGGKRQVLVNNIPQEQRAIDDGRRTTNIPIQDGNLYGQRQQSQYQQSQYPQYQFQQPQQFQQPLQFQQPQQYQQPQRYQQRSVNQQQYQQPPLQQQHYQDQEYQDSQYSTHPKDDEDHHHKKHGFFSWSHRKH